MIWAYLTNQDLVHEHQQSLCVRDHVVRLHGQASLLDIYKGWAHEGRRSNGWGQTATPSIWKHRIWYSLGCWDWPNSDLYRIPSPVRPVQGYSNQKEVLLDFTASCDSNVITVKPAAVAWNLAPLSLRCQWDQAQEHNPVKILFHKWSPRTVRRELVCPLNRMVSLRLEEIFLWVRVSFIPYKR